MKNLKLGKKFLLSFGLILLFFVLVSVVTVSTLVSISDSYRDFYEGPHQISSEIMELRRDMLVVSNNILYAMEIGDITASRNYLTQAQLALDSLKERALLLHTCTRISSEELAQFEQTLLALEEPKEKIFDLVPKQHNAAAIDVYFVQYSPLLNRANRLLETMHEEIQVSSQTEFEEAQQQTQQTFLILIALLLSTFGLTVFLGYRLTVSLARPIRELEHAATEIAGGNFTVDIHYTAKDELGSLSQSMRVMSETVKAIISDLDNSFGALSEGDFTVTSTVDHLYQKDFSLIKQSTEQLITRISATLTQINQAADQVAVGSDQVSSGAQALSHGAAEQASSIDELLATISEISRHIKENAQTANHAKTESELMAEQILHSNQRMQEMIGAMEVITDKSNQIRKIIKTIDEIAFQTNILALNAAVEAARAGEAGKGFAVVADEVRNLAGKSAEAAKNTSHLIEEAIAAVKNGTTSANETASSILGVVEQSHEFTRLVQGISTASSEQAMSVAHVTTGVEQISGVIQTNSATAEQSAAASEELSGQAQLLKELVHHFKLTGMETQQPVEEDNWEQIDDTYFEEPVTSSSKY